MKVLLADDHAIVRQGIGAILSGCPGIDICAEAQTGLDAVKSAGRHQPDVVLMDISMPDMNGIEATRLIRKTTPDARVLVLSMHADRHFVLNALQAGASGYILKDCAFEELLTAINTVMRGEVYLSGQVAEMVTATGKKSLPGVGSVHLSAREREIFRWVQDGKTSWEIAMIVGISERTVKFHVKNVMRKLGASSRVQAVAAVMSLGLLNDG
jgi:DNA-binding NarL/FixJ family response regulator